MRRPVSANSRAAALALGAAIMLVPAYALPVMFMRIVGETAKESTILSGVLQLYRQGLWGLAAIVFTASFLVPLLKLAGLAGLLVAVRRGTRQPRRLTQLYAIIDSIGRWSMLDVFLVAFLCGAVRFGKLAFVEPLSGIFAFASVVVLTMLATQAFDPRQLWTPPSPPETPAGLP